MAFFLLLKGEGEGCDYTIGCNKTYKVLKADSAEQAIGEVRTKIASYSEPAIEEALLLETTHVCPIDCKAIYKEINAAKVARQAAKTAEKRKQAYLELKAEF